MCRSVKFLPFAKMENVNEKSSVLSKKKQTPSLVWVATAFSALGGLLFGYDTGVVSGAMILMRDYFSLDSTMQGVVVSVTIIAAWLFSLLGGQLADRFGRKIVIMLASLVFAAGSLLMGLASHTWLLITGRAVVGMGVGLVSMCVPLYIAEIAPREVRGALVTVNNCAITFGQLVASLVGGAFSSDYIHGWRYMLGLGALPAVIQFFGFLFLPESPRWLVARGRHEEALRVLQRLQAATEDARAEFDAIRENCLQAENERKEANSSVIRRVLSSQALCTALLVGCGLQMIQQLSGINTIMYYSASIIEMSGIKDKSKVIWLSAVTAATNSLFSLVGLLLVERLGRRRLTLVSLCGVCVSLAALGASFQLAKIHSPSLSYQDPSTVGTPCHAFSTCGQCVEESRGQCGYCFTQLLNHTYEGACLVGQGEDQSVGGACNRTDMPQDLTWAHWCPSSYTWMTFAGLLFYLFCFAPGMGCMPWTVNSEIYPLWARSTCFSISTSLNWICNFVVSLTFLDLLQLLTRYGAFYLYCCMALAGLIFLFFMLPETRGVSLEEVEGLFERPWWRNGAPSERRTVQYTEPHL